MNNFENFKFRASSVGNLMSKPKKKSETLAETTKHFLREVYIGKVYKRDYDLNNKFLEKGNYCEEDSLSLVTSNRKKLYLKNKDQFENEFVKGTPDIIEKDNVIDIKTCWDIRTFVHKTEVISMYYWQLQSYMWLTGKDHAELIFTLVNAPEHLIVAEKNKRMWQLGISTESPEWAKEEGRIEKLMLYDDIDPTLRMKVFKTERSQEDIERLIGQIEVAREFLGAITLNG